MANTKKVAFLLEKKRKISKEIKGLQNKCNHFNKSIKSIKEREDSSTFIIRWICDDCEKVVGMLSKQEINEYLNGSR